MEKEMVVTSTSGTSTGLVYVIFAIAILVLTCGCSISATTKKELSKMTNEASSFTYDGNNIKYYENGVGKPLLLLHGFGASSYSWRYVTKALNNNYRLITVDLKGFGMSDKPEDNKYSVEYQSDIIIGLINHLNLNNITIIGHSFGGAVTLFTTLKLNEMNRKEVVKNLILIDSAGYNQRFPYFINVLRTPLLNHLSLLLPNKMNTKILLMKAFFDNKKITNEMIEIYASYLSLPGASHALIETANQIVPNNIDLITAKYKNIKQPVLAIWGQNDEIVPLAIGKRLSKDIPNARLEIISNCGHVPHEERPVDTIKFIKDFLLEQ